MDIIIRKFAVNRGGREIVYPFTTFDCIFQEEKGILGQLYSHLRKVFIEGVLPHGQSVSEAPTYIVKTEKRESDLIQFAKQSNYENRGKFQHEVLQEYLLKHDPNTLAIEIPVFNDTYLGHIDVLRYLSKEDMIEIADFKPNAHKETKATSQIARYRELLSRNTGIPIKKIRALYFDHKNCYYLI